MFLLAAIASAAPADPYARARLDALVEPALDAWMLHHVVVGVVADGRREIWAYGDGVDARAVFELGGATHAVTGVLLGDAVQRGQIPVDATIDEIFGLEPPADGRSVALFDLATHTSGLPRMPVGFRPSDPANPFAGSTSASVLDDLRRSPAVDAPGSTWAFSQLGMAVLGQALERATGSTYAALVDERLVGPLGLQSLGVDGPVAIGHDVDLRPVPAWTTDAWTPALGLKSNADDLLKVLAACLDRPAVLGPALNTATGRQRDLGEAGAAGLGWQIAPDGTVWANGQTGGHHAMIAFHPERRLAVVALSDVASGLTDAIGFGALGALAGQTPTPLPVPRPGALDDATYDVWVGDYGPASVRREGVALLLVLPDQPARRLWPLADEGFALRSPPGEVRFEGRKLVLTQDGQPVQEWRRR